jgi:hypothetical protein
MANRFKRWTEERLAHPDGLGHMAQAAAAIGRGGCGTRAQPSSTVNGVPAFVFGPRTIWPRARR